MPGGCWVCNPLCGKCQPAPKKSGNCPTCGTCTIFDRVEISAGETLLCKKCGEDLTPLVRPKTIRCQYSGLVCIYPCGKGTNSRSDHGFQVCKRNTPPSEEWLAAHQDFQKNRKLFCKKRTHYRVGSFLTYAVQPLAVQPLDVINFPPHEPLDIPQSIFWLPPLVLAHTLLPQQCKSHYRA